MKKHALLAIFAALFVGIVFPFGAGGEPSAFARVDSHALSAPTSAAKSVDALAAYLGQGLSSDGDKARAVYRWITNAIDYDTEAFFTGKIGSQSADAVLRSRKSVCAGYSALFADLGRRLGLTVEVVSGYAKGYGYVPGAPFTKTNHDWNAVSVDGRWRLVDSTWGAGYVDDGKRFVKEYSDFYFLTPPEKFVLRHFPVDPKWQLLEHPWTMDDYSAAVYTCETGLSLGVSPRSHIKGAFTCGGRDRLVFDAPPDVVPTSTIEEIDNATLTQMVPGGFEVLCAFPAPGSYTLNVYAKKVSEPGSYSSALQYTVNVENGAGPDCLFPASYSNYCTRGVTLTSPLARRLKAGTSVDFSLAIAGAEKVAVVSGGKWTYLEKKDAQWTGAAAVAPGAVQVCAKCAGGPSFEGILGYEAR
jgi:hypothetical protein